MASAGIPLGRRISALLLAAAAIVLAALAAATLLPHAASEPNGIGYDSWCPFAPVSTLMLAGLAYFVWGLRRKVLAGDASD